MLIFDQTDIYATSFSDFLPFLNQFYQEEITVPPRLHYDIPSGSSSGTLLLMPSWQQGGYTGIKIISVYPDNAHSGLSTIQGLYLLMDANNGSLLASFDGPSLTTIRTAAVSALASDLISPIDIKTMLMLGTGNLCHALIQAHLAVRSPKVVWIWGRNYEKAKARAATLQLQGVDIKAIKKREEVMRKADLISAATYAVHPLISGNMLKNNVHLDLVGSYKPDMREADDACLKEADVYVDDYQALNESGDIVIPLSNGTLVKEDILADLVALTKMDKRVDHRKGRTVFKSVGNARSDLALAVYLYEQTKPIHED